MKKLILILLLLLSIISLDAKEVEVKNTFDLSFTGIEIFYKEISPAFKISSKVSNLIDFTLIYANNLITKSLLKRPVDMRNPKAQSLYVSMNYRF